MLLSPATGPGPLLRGETCGGASVAVKPRIGSVASRLSRAHGVGSAAGQDGFSFLFSHKRGRQAWQCAQVGFLIGLELGICGVSVTVEILLPREKVPGCTLRGRIALLDGGTHPGIQLGPPRGPSSCRLVHCCHCRGRLWAREQSQVSAGSTSRPASAARACTCRLG